MTKFEKLDAVKQVLLTTSEFVQKFLPLANAHNCDFITKNLWSNLLTCKVQDQLLLLSQDELHRLLSFDYKEECPSTCVQCGLKKTDTTQTADSRNSVETFKMQYSSKRVKWDKDQVVEWDSDYELEDFVTVVHHHIKMLKCLVATSSDLCLLGSDHGFQDPVNPLHIPHGMTEKKSHEIKLMTAYCASLARAQNIAQVVDIGSGRGYLGCQLSLMHGVKVLGIDSSVSNTQSAEKRTSKVQKYWPGLMKKAKENLMKAGVDPTKSNMLSDKSKADTSEMTLVYTYLNQSLSQVDKTNDQTSGDQVRDSNGSDSQVPASNTPEGTSPKDSASVVPDKDKLYVPITCYVTPSTDIWQLICDNYKVSGVETEDTCSSTVLLTGLHTCGDLASSILRLFATNSNVQAVCNVGCCYHHIEEEFVCSPFKQEEDLPPDFGFPLSQTLRDVRVQLGRNARMLACQSTDRLAQNKKLPDVSLYWRALLQVILRDLTGELRDDWQVGKIAAKCTDFTSYVKKALVKLKLPYKLSDEDIKAYDIKYHPYKYKMQAFFQLKAVLAPAIELFILVDRLCFLLEQENTKDAHILKLFDEVTSPRCYTIVAIK